MLIAGTFPVIADLPMKQESHFDRNPYSATLPIVFRSTLCNGIAGQVCWWIPMIPNDWALYLGNLRIIPRGIIPHGVIPHSVIAHGIIPHETPVVYCP